MGLLQVAIEDEPADDQNDGHRGQAGE